VIGSRWPAGAGSAPDWGWGWAGWAPGLGREGPAGLPRLGGPRLRPVALAGRGGLSAGPAGDAASLVRLREATS